MGDPRRLFDAKDMAGAILYAKRITADEDAYPLLANADGSLIVSVTSATVSLSSTKVTVDNTVTVTGTVTTSAASTASTITNAVSNPANVSLTNTLVTVGLISGQAAIAAGVGASGASVPRVVLANDHGKSLSSSSGTLTATSGVLVIGGSNKTKVYAFSLTTTSTTGAICSFHTGGYTGTELWRVLLQAPSGANAGANLAVTPPAYLFATASNGTLRLNLSASIRVDFSVAYYDEA